MHLNPSVHTDLICVSTQRTLVGATSELKANHLVLKAQRFIFSVRVKNSLHLWEGSWDMKIQEEVVTCKKLDCLQWDAVLFVCLKVASEGSACWGWMIRFHNIINLKGVQNLCF